LDDGEYSDMTLSKYFLVICFWILAIVFGWFKGQEREYGWYIFLVWVLLMTITSGWIIKSFKIKDKESH